MPRSNFTQARVREEYGEGYRRCPRCGGVAPATARYFYQRPGNGRLELCIGCRGEYFREYGARRRAGAVNAGDNRRFGVEIEFSGASENAVKNALLNAGINCEIEGYNHQTRGHWKIVSDSSVDDGAELVSPPLQGDAGRDQIRTVCRAMRSVGATVNASCGLHVHHEVVDLSVGQFHRLYRLWSNAADAIDTFVAASRRHGNWSTHISASEVEYVERITSMDRSAVESVANGIDRYKNLNIQSFPRYGTVEVRLHQGTVNATKILNWIALGQSTVTYAKTVRPIPFAGISSAGFLAAMVAQGGMKQETAEWLARRRVALSGGTVTDGPPDAVPDADDRAAESYPEDFDGGSCDCCDCDACREYRGENTEEW